MLCLELVERSKGQKVKGLEAGRWAAQCQNILPRSEVVKPDRELLPNGSKNKTQEVSEPLLRWIKFTILKELQICLKLPKLSHAYFFIMA